MKTLNKDLKHSVKSQYYKHDTNKKLIKFDKLFLLNNMPKVELCYLQIIGLRVRILRNIKIYTWIAKKIYFMFCTKDTENIISHLGIWRVSNE